MLQKDLFGGYTKVKRCPYCGKMKEVFEFYQTKSGYQSYCKECQKKYHLRHPRKEYKQNKRDNYSLRLFTDEQKRNF